MKKKLMLFVLLVLATFTVVGCNGSKEPAIKDLKVALALTGAINDGGWNQRGYEALIAINAKYGAETAYNENTQPAQYNLVIRNYAKDGYNIIVANGTQFTDAVKEVASEYPDITFIVTSSDRTAKIGNGSNIAGVIGDGVEQGFLQGVAAAYLAKEIGATKVGGIGGTEIPAFKTTIEGFVLGANYVDKTIGVMTAFTGSLDDANKMKEQAITFIQQGAGVVLSHANAASRGGFEATQTLGKLSVAANATGTTMTTYANNVSASANVNLSFAVLDVVDKKMEGTFKGTDYIFGIEEGVVTITYSKTEPTIQKVKDKIEAVVADVKSGKIDINALYTASKK